MQRRKRGNGYRLPKRYVQLQKEKRGQPCPRPLLLVPTPARVMLSHRDTITGNYDRLSSLFYEFYRGYTIYSTERGTCCIHGPGRGGCLQIEGRYAAFPDIEDAKALIKWSLAVQRTAWEGMNWRVPQEVYICLNGYRGEVQQAHA